MSKVSEVTLSGGEFGGAIVPSSEFINDQVKMKDQNGDFWIYDLTVSSEATRAEFVSFEKGE